MPDDFFNVNVPPRAATSALPRQRQEPQGAFLSGLDWLDRLSEPVKNVLAGQPGGAGRQLVDLIGDVPDAFLPGDWIDHIAREEDFVRPADLAGIDREQNPFLAGTADFIGDVALNPSTYIPGAWIAKGARGLGAGASKVASMLPEAAQPTVKAAKDFGSEAGRLVRRISGAQRLTPENKLVAQDADAAGNLVAMAQAGGVADLLKGTTAAEQQALGMIAHNIRFDPRTGQALGLIDETGTLSMPDRARLFLQQAPDGVNPELVQSVAERYPSLAKTQLDEAQGAGIGGNVFYQGSGAADYFPRQFSGLREGDIGLDSFGRMKSYKGRKLETSADVLDFLKNNPEVRLNFNAAQALSARAEQAGHLAKKGSVGNVLWGRLRSKELPLPEALAALQKTHGEKYVEEILSKPFAVADDAQSGHIKAALKDMERAAPEDAQVLGDLYNGLPPRHPVTHMLERAMKPFKRFAVFGAIIPKLSTDVSNAISGVAQVAMNPEARFFTGQAGKNLWQTVFGAINDGAERVFGVRLGENEFAAMDAAARASGGSVKGMLEKIDDPMLKAALKNGVLGDNMVTAEQMINAGNKVGVGKVFNNIWEAPAEVFKGVEQRMRYALFKALVNKNIAEMGAEVASKDAARIVGDTFYSYRISSKENRLARDIIPFFQFQAKAIPQSAKFFAEKPYAAVALAQLAGAGSGEELYPYMEGRLNLPLGKDEAGHNQYISGFRLPFEALNSIPNPSAGLREFGKQVRQNVVGAANPILKTAFGAVSGIDPFFGTPYGSYDKIPLIGEAGKAGQAYNIAAGTGLIQAIDSPLRYLNQILDERHGPAVRALDALTGANVVSVDPDQAIQQHLQQALETNPSVRQYRGYYGDENDDETQNVIREYEAAKARLKAKRNAEAAAAKQSASSVF